MNKEFHANLAKSIRAGISKYQDILAKNQAKEKNGLEKLNKTLGGNDPALTGAGGNLSAGSATTEVPNLARAEYKVKKGPGERTFGDGMRVEHSNPSSKGKSPFNFSVYGRSDEAIASSKKKNTRAEYEASKVEKGELGMDAGCPCGGSAMSMGIHSGQSHTMCSGCGAIGTTPQEENTAAMAGGDPTVAKGEKVSDSKRGEEPNTASTYKDKAKVKNKRAEYEASKVEKAEPLATVRTTTAKGISGLPAPKSKMVVKAETNPNTKQADMVGTVEAKNVKGAKDGSESVPEAKKTDGSGDVSKGKIEKGALVDYVKAASAKAGVSAGKVLSHGDPKAGRGGYQVPKTLQTAKPAPTPNFNKGEKDSAPKWEGAGKYKDAAHKEYVKGSAKIVGDKDTKVAKGEMGKLPDGSGFATGTVKKGEVRGADVKGNYNVNVPEKGTKITMDHLWWHHKDAAHQQIQAAKNNKVAEHKASQVEKSAIPMTGHAAEMAIKTGRPTIPGRPMVTKLTGGFQGQIAAQKKPLIPMVNTGVVAKGETVSTQKGGQKKFGEDPFKPISTVESKTPSGHIAGVPVSSHWKTYQYPTGESIQRAKKNNKVAESKAQEVEKAEPTMAKPVTKSPSSGAAGKAAPIKSTVAPKAPSKL
jgi:hypothetical protein